MSLTKALPIAWVSLRATASSNPCFTSASKRFEGNLAASAQGGRKPVLPPVAFDKSPSSPVPMFSTQPRHLDAMPETTHTSARMTDCLRIRIGAAAPLIASVMTGSDHIGLRRHAGAQ
jgi:hypothetical protein